VGLIPYQDPWPSAQPRWWDIDDGAFSDFIAKIGTPSQFAYTSGQATLTYDTAPDAAYFVGHIEATGLKPNFAYQLKLIGKPVYGSRGWKSYGDDTANERIGYAGRWWCDTEQKNVDDAHYQTFYQNKPPSKRHTVYGYLFLGVFVTDELGRASVDFAGDHSYHITWQDKQTWGNRQVVAGTWTVQSLLSPYYGYGYGVPSKPVTLWYEYEPGRPDPVNLASGTYHARFLLTEESFHNQLGGTNDPLGGFWLSVLVNEDFDASGNPDSSPDNDVVFTLGGGGGMMTAAVDVTLAKVRNKWQANAWVTVKDNNSQPVGSASVTGDWSGAYNNTGVSGSTGSDGVARFVTPRVAASSGQYFRFTVTNVVKSGYTWDGVQKSDTETVP